MPNAVLRVDPWRHRLHRLHRMYGLSCLHCRLHLSCLHQTPWYLQSAFETLGRSRKVVWLFHTVPTSDIRNCIRNCYLEAACLPPRWKAELTRWYATNFRHHHLYLRLFWDFPQIALLNFSARCWSFTSQGTMRHAKSEASSMAWDFDESLSLNRGRVFLLPWSLECLWNCFTCTALALQWMSFSTLKAWRTCFTWDPIWGIGWWFCACQTCWFNRLLVTFGHWSCGMDPGWTLSISFSRKVDMFVKTTLALHRPFLAQRVPTQTWLKTPQKVTCFMMPAIWFLSISLADCISSASSRICFLMLAMSVFSGQTRQDGGFGNRGNAEHGTKHVLHVGALTPQSFRQMVGDIWSVDGYWISKTHSRKTLRPHPSNRMLTRPRSSIHPHSIIQAAMMSMIRIFQTEGPWMSRVRFSSACARLSACRIFRLTCTHNNGHEKLQELQDHKMHLKLNLTFVALQTCSILFLLLNHCLSQELQIWGIFRNWATRL